MMSHRFSDTAYGLSSQGGDWRENAACRDVDPEIFLVLSDRTANPGHIESRQSQAQVAAAKAVCARCVSVEACLAWALEVRDQYAILAGTTPAERRIMSPPGPRMNNRGKVPQPTCARGHEFDEANTAYDGRGQRRCRTCCRIRDAARAEAREARLSGVPS